MGMVGPVSCVVHRQYRNDEHGAWIFRDNTGLKGLAAQWARQHLEGHPGKGGRGRSSLVVMGCCRVHSVIRGKRYARTVTNCS